MSFSVPGGPQLGEYTDEEGQHILDNFYDMDFGTVTFISRYGNGPIAMTNIENKEQGLPNMILITDSAVENQNAADYVASIRNGECTDFDQ